MYDLCMTLTLHETDNMAKLGEAKLDFVMFALEFQTLQT